METNVRTPQQVFMLPQHLVVPAFQRPYVWEREEQWEPLWQDVRRLADLRADPLTADATHFLGAVVVQAQPPALGGLMSSSIIDGQQRMTTLQLLTDAVAAELERRGHDDLALQLTQLTHNDAHFVGQGVRLKLRQSNRDRHAFDEVMEAPVPVDYTSLEHPESRVARAHEYFSNAVASWLVTGDEAAPPRRAAAITGALLQGIQLVVINLQANENAQEIFETLNARGTPLDAADLIRNFVFQRLAQQGADVDDHLEQWPFETSFWETSVSVGRFPMQRSSLFFNQWLISRLREEVGPRATFSRFKQYVEATEREEPGAMVRLLPEIRRQADDYERWTQASADPDRQLNRVELAMYRLDASDSQILKPVLIWLHEPGREHGAPVAEGVIDHVESWLVRRQLLRLSVGDLGRVVADLLRVHDGTPSDALASSVQSFLARLDVTSTYWPSDEEIRERLATERIFKSVSRKARLRMLLEAIEDDFRAETNQPRVPRRGYPIEHLLPQTWRPHWPVAGPDEEQERDAHIHRLGNLTLLTQTLNSKVSNAAWSQKRTSIAAHDTLLLNSRLLKDAEAWDEQAIDRRTDALTDVLLKTWPVPVGHEGRVRDPHEKTAGSVSVKHLVDSGSLQPGTVLRPPSDTWGAVEATVRPDGNLEVGGQAFDNPSRAARHVVGGARNGWGFWRLSDGRRLGDVRAAYAGVPVAAESIGKPEAERWSADELARLHANGGRTIRAVLDALSDAPGDPMDLTALAEAVRREPAELNADLGAFTRRLRSDFGHDNWPFAAVRSPARDRFVYSVDPETAKAWVSFGDAASSASGLG